MSFVEQFVGYVKGEKGKPTEKAVPSSNLNTFVEQTHIKTAQSLPSTNTPVASFTQFAGGGLISNPPAYQSQVESFIKGVNQDSLVTGEVSKGGPGSGRHGSEFANTKQEHKAAANYHMEQKDKADKNNDISAREAHRDAQRAHNMAASSPGGEKSSAARAMSHRANSINFTVKAEKPLNIKANTAPQGSMLSYMIASNIQKGGDGSGKKGGVRGQQAEQANGAIAHQEAAQYHKEAASKLVPGSSEWSAHNKAADAHTRAANVAYSNMGSSGGVGEIARNASVNAHAY